MPAMSVVVVVFLVLSIIHILFLVFVELTSNACWKNLVFYCLYQQVFDFVLFMHSYV